VCSGKGANAAKTELEKILNKRGTAGITCKEAVFELAKILQLVRDQSKEKPLELEMGWLCEATGWKHSLVPKDLLNEADKLALASVEGMTLPDVAVESEPVSVEEVDVSAIEGGAEEKLMDVDI